MAFRVDIGYGQTPPPITSSGLNTQISGPEILPGGVVKHNITGGTRPGGGANLFHSFGEFGVPTNNIANFLNDSALPTTNILSRVTGGNPSNIFGRIQTTEGFGNANLFLMNPAGIVFGPDASLNVGGATHFTTADYLRLADGMQFTAMPSAQDALLSIAPVAAFGFLGPNPGAISVDGSTLSVEEGQTLSLVGGDITIGNSSLNAPGGKIAVASVASPGEVLNDTYANASNVNGESFTTMGNIALSEGAKLDVSDNAAGSVIIRGGELMMTNATISADTVESNGAPMAVNIQVSGDFTIIDTQGSPAISARTTGSGNAGEVSISAENIEVTSSALPLNPLNPMAPLPFSLIDTHTSGSGTAGKVNVTATGTIQATGENQGDMYLIDSGTIGENGGHGGEVVIAANHLQLTDANINTGDWIAQNVGSATGSGGNLTITADTIQLNSTFVTTDGFFEGKAGDISITANDIQFDDTSNLRLAEVGGGGALTINANNFTLDRTSGIESETLDGRDAGLPWTSVAINAEVVTLQFGSIIKSQTFGDGAAGDIRVIATDHMTLSDVGDTIRPSGLFTNSVGGEGVMDEGPAGNIFIETGRLELSGGARIDSSTQSMGKGGDVTILASNDVLVSGQRLLPIPEVDVFGLGSSLPSGIFSRTVGSEFCHGGPCGAAGNISLTTGSLNVTDGGAINSGTTSSGQGGVVDLKALGNISISGTLNDGTAGGIFSQTTGTDSDSGGGGTIALNADQNFTLSDGATMSASSSGPGNAGAIVIDVTGGSFAIAQGGVVDSGTTSTGAGGAITVHASDNISITGTLDGTPGGVLSQTTGAGAGGDISLTAGQNFTLSDGATVSASSDGPGNAGNINITAHDTILLENATVTTEATEAFGGNIKLTADNLIQLTDSQVTSRVQVGSGNAGSIELDPDFIVLKNSKVLSTAISGDGGPITLIANSAILIDAFSELNANSQFGGSGTIDIQAPIQNLSGTIVPLPQDPVPVTALYGSRCVAGAGGHFSTFVDSKADSLAPTPGTFLASPFLPFSSSSRAVALSHANKREGSEKVHAALLQVAAYSPPVLFGQGDEMLTACP